MLPCLRCPKCGSDLGPGCDCFRADFNSDYWENSMAKKLGGRQPRSLNLWNSPKPSKSTTCDCPTNYLGKQTHMLDCPKFGRIF